MLKQVFNADLNSIEQCNELINEEGEKNGFTPRELNQIQLAVEECVVNIVKHAYQSDKNKEFIFNIEYINNERPSLKCVFIDSGPPFNPLEKADPDTGLALEEREIGGLGILMIKQMMDELDYHYTNKKNHFIMVKYRNMDNG